MDLTDKFFSKNLKILSKYQGQLEAHYRTANQVNKEDSNAMKIYTGELVRLQNLIQAVEQELANTFKELFENGFSLSGYEAAKMLDVTEHYLFLKLKDKLNYIKPPRTSFLYFEKEISKREFEIDQLKIQVEKEGRAPLDEEIERATVLVDEINRFNALNLKKVFIDIASMRDFLKEYAVVEAQRAQIYIEPSELDHEINQRISNRIIKEVVEFYEARAEDRKSSKEPQEDVALVEKVLLPDTVIEQLLNREITFYSPKSIKDLIQKKSINELNSTVHDTQLYRFLDKKGEYSRVNILSTIKQGRKKLNQSVIRYLLDLEIQAEKFIQSQSDDCLIFSIPISEYNEEIKQEVIDLINEAMSKFHERKSKKKDKN